MVGFMEPGIENILFPPLRLSSVPSTPSRFESKVDMDKLSRDEQVAIDRSHAHEDYDAGIEIERQPKPSLGKKLSTFFTKTPKLEDAPLPPIHAKVSSKSFKNSRLSGDEKAVTGVSSPPSTFDANVKSKHVMPKKRSIFFRKTPQQENTPPLPAPIQDNTKSKGAANSKATGKASQSSDGPPHLPLQCDDIEKPKFSLQVLPKSKSMFFRKAEQSSDPPRPLHSQNGGIKKTRVSPQVLSKSKSFFFKKTMTSPTADFALSPLPQKTLDRLSRSAGVPRSVSVPQSTAFSQTVSMPRSVSVPKHVGRADFKECYAQIDEGLAELKKLKLEREQLEAARKLAEAEREHLRTTQYYDRLGSERQRRAAQDKQYAKYRAQREKAKAKNPTVSHPHPHQMTPPCSIGKESEESKESKEPKQSKMRYKYTGTDNGSNQSNKGSPAPRLSPFISIPTPATIGTAESPSPNSLKTKQDTSATFSLSEMPQPLFAGRHQKKERFQGWLHDCITEAKEEKLRSRGEVVVIIYDEKNNHTGVKNPCKQPDRYMHNPYSTLNTKAPSPPQHIEVLGLREKKSRMLKVKKSFSNLKVKTSTYFKLSPTTEPVPPLPNKIQAGFLRGFDL